MAQQRLAARIDELQVRQAQAPGFELTQVPSMHTETMMRVKMLRLVYLLPLATTGAAPVRATRRLSVVRRRIFMSSTSFTRLQAALAERDAQISALQPAVAEAATLRAQLAAAQQALAAKESEVAAAKEAATEAAVLRKRAAAMEAEAVERQ